MNWHVKLLENLARGAGVRMGEAAIVSRRVHLTDPALPDQVTVLADTDAGRTFYGRLERDEVVHVDVFHQVADVDHRQVAAAVAAALQGAGLPELADLFDVQTATGGGRVTGDLTFGRRPSLRHAHRNHVHVAGLVPEGDLALLAPLVAAVEDAIIAQGREIRRVESLRHRRGQGGPPLDLSPYADNMDSYLKEAGGNEGHQSGLGPALDPGSLARARGQRGAAAGADASGGGSGYDGGATWGHTARGDITLAQALGAAQTASHLDGELQLQWALGIARRMGSPEELKRILDALQAREAHGQGRAEGSLSLSGLLNGSAQLPALLRELEEQGIVQRDGRGCRLTPAGRTLAALFDSQLREVRMRFRKLIRRAPARSSPRPTSAPQRPAAQMRSGPIRGTAPAAAGEWVADVAVPETLRAALVRSHHQHALAGADTAPRFGVARSDIHVYRRSGDQPLNICLLIDASASMAGRRILAAKHLVRHLLAATRDRVAVVGFQEKHVQVHVPFTRDFTVMEQGLSRLQPLGLTPLAHGLTAGVELMQTTRARRPLLLLITDGIPTVAKWTQDPLADAFAAARQVAEARIPFGCIGLMPARRYLEELARTAGGTLHVVEELDEQALLTIAHRERLRRSRR